MKLDRQGLYDLFLDESGTFTETEPGSPAAVLGPSQLVGLLAPRGAVTPSSAAAALFAACEAASLPLGDEIHGMMVPKGEAFDRLLSRLADEVEQRGWQPVRLVNREAVGYGDRGTTYVNLVAELVTRVLEETGRDRRGRITVNLLCASVKLGRREDGAPLFLEKEEYLRRLRESVAYTAVRRGDAPSAPSWTVGELAIRSGRKRRELQICDILSNASYDDFRKCGAATGNRLRSAFGRFDFSLVRHDLCRRVDDLIDQFSPASALIAIAERLSEADGGGTARDALEDRLATVLRQLASMSAEARDAHLQQVVAWNRQLLSAQRSGDAAYRFARWFLAIAESFVRRLLPDGDRSSLDWFSFSLHRLALAASNRRGALADARAESAEIDRLLPALAGEWEHVDAMMEGLVTQAAHYVESCHFFLAADRMRAVDAFYESMSAPLSAALPGVFPGRVRSRVRGKALGTLVQAEMAASLREPERLGEARRVSDRAIAEFPSPSGRARQFLHRCRLESAAGDFAESLRFLALGLGLPERARHTDVAGAIRRLDLPEQGFPLLHWLRLGADATRAGSREAGDPFLEALSGSRLLRSHWIEGPSPMDYPAHGIRRQAAVLHAIRGFPEEADAVLRNLARLGHLEAGRMGPSLVHLAALAEVAGILWESAPETARRLLDSDDPDRPGVRRLVGELAARHPREYGIVAHVLADWPAAIDEVVSGRVAPADASRILQSLARPVGR